MRSMLGVSMSPPKVSMALKPTSSSTMYSTLGAPFGARGCSYGPQSGVESLMSMFTTPAKCLGMGPSGCAGVRPARLAVPSHPTDPRRCHGPARVPCCLVPPRVVRAGAVYPLSGRVDRRTPFRGSARRFEARLPGRMTRHAANRPTRPPSAGAARRSPSHSPSSGNGARRRTCAPMARGSTRSRCIGVTHGTGSAHGAWSRHRLRRGPVSLPHRPERGRSRRRRCPWTCRSAASMNPMRSAR